MKIGIDISQTAYIGTGVARYTNGLINAVLEYDKENKWVFFFSSLRNSVDKDLKRKIEKKGHRLVLTKLPPTLLSFLWNDLHLFKIEHFTGNLDWFITSDWVEPPSNMKKATIVHDLVFLIYPETVDKKILNTQKKRLYWVKKESNIIFCVSNTTKQDFTNLFNIDEKKLTAIYSGVNILTPSKKQIEETLIKYNIKKPFILSVGKIEPRKNIKKLIQAYNLLGNKDIDLLIAGPSGWGKEVDIKNRNIKILGLISDIELFSLYSSCLFFIYPSIYEGFGYPVLEAMKIGAAVATSNTSALSEIGKDSAYLFNPKSTEDIKNALCVMIKDKALRDRLKRKGIEKSKIFTWKNCYENMIKKLKSKNDKLEVIKSNPINNYKEKQDIRVWKPNQFKK